MKSHHKWIVFVGVFTLILILFFKEDVKVPLQHQSTTHQQQRQQRQQRQQQQQQQQQQRRQQHQKPEYISVDHESSDVHSISYTSNNIIPEQDLCTHDGILHILSSLRRDCLGGKCDLDKLLNQMNSITNADFLSLVRQAQNNKVTFFFKKGKSDLSSDQLDEKLDLLNSLLTTNVRNRRNTVAFIIAKASTTGGHTLNRTISSQRAVYIHELIKRSFIEANISPYLACNEIYRTYVGSETFQLSEDLATQTGYISQSDINRAKSLNEDVTEYINQSVILFTYPCFNEMCQYMHKNLGMTCTPGEDQLPDECHEMLCDE